MTAEEFQVEDNDGGHGGPYAWRGNRRIGRAFPQVADRLDGAWFAKLIGQPARLFDDRAGAINYLAEESA